MVRHDRAEIVIAKSAAAIGSAQMQIALAPKSLTVAD
jgi:hypothetical protein